MAAAASAKADTRCVYLLQLQLAWRVNQTWKGGGGGGLACSYSTGTVNKSKALALLTDERFPRVGEVAQVSASRFWFLRRLLTLLRVPELVS